MKIYILKLQNRKGLNEELESISSWKYRQKWQGKKNGTGKKTFCSGQEGYKDATSENGT